MKNTDLIQRLGPPPESELHAKAEQVFGGAQLGLRPEAWKALQRIFSIDYMGDANYEFGAVPTCLKEMAADHEQLNAFSMLVRADDIEPNWNRGVSARTKRGQLRKKQPLRPPVLDRTVHVLCRQGDAEAIQERVRLLAGGKLPNRHCLSFASALDPIGEYDGRICGWLELDNGFFFFVDKTMWRRTTCLFTGTDPAAE